MKFSVILCSLLFQLAHLCFWPSGKSKLNTRHSLIFLYCTYRWSACTPSHLGTFSGSPLRSLCCHCELLNSEFHQGCIRCQNQSTLNRDKIDTFGNIPHILDLSYLPDRHLGSPVRKFPLIFFPDVGDASNLQPLCKETRWKTHLKWTCSEVTNTAIIMSGPDWTSMDPYGRVWTSRDKSWQVWTSLNQSGQVWTSMNKSGWVWMSLDKSWQLWTSLDKSGQLWTSLGKSRRVSMTLNESWRVLKSLDESGRIWTRWNMMEHDGTILNKFKHG